jgi:hypothetical protein
MRRGVEIFLDFQRKTRHAHPHREAALRNYAGLLKAMGRSEAEIRAALASWSGRRNDGGVGIRRCAAMVGCAHPTALWAGPRGESWAAPAAPTGTT